MIFMRMRRFEGKSKANAPVFDEIASETARFGDIP
jgi:hypothetical protein